MRAAFVASCLLVLAAVAFGEGKDPSGYQKGTISGKSSSGKDCEVRFTDGAYGISKCGDFQEGQALEYRVAGDTLYLRTDGATEYKRHIESRTEKNDLSKIDLKDLPKPIVWLKGTIEGYGTRRDSGSSGRNSSSLTFNIGGGKVKIYELHGAEANYEISACGSFQAGKFSPGQEVEYRVDGERLYIRHDGNRTYSCQIEGKRLPDTRTYPVSP